MRSVFRLLWMVSVLVIVALLSALTAMRLAIHGREVTVPDMQGKTPAEARRMAESSGLEADVEREYYSPAIPEGKVLSQMPAAGSTVRRGWQVRLALSLGPQRVVIPQVVGESDRAAAITIAQRGLNLGGAASLEIPNSAPGQVIAQNPQPNATNASAPKISLLVSQAPAPQSFVMPSFVGQPLGSVTLALKDAGFTVGKVTVAPVENAPEATNAASVPAAPAPAPPPAPATANPASAPAPSPSVPVPSAASFIVSQDPVPGERVLAGTAINFVVK
jgi:beta-lactam-binding protein with PASTA domain